MCLLLKKYYRNHKGHTLAEKLWLPNWMAPNESVIEKQGQRCNVMAEEQSRGTYASCPGVGSGSQ